MIRCNRLQPVNNNQLSHEEINRSVEQVATISAETAQAMDQASSAVAELAQQSQALQKLIVEMKNG